MPWFELLNMRFVILYIFTHIVSCSLAQFNFNSLRETIHNENYSAAIRICDSCILKKFQKDSALFYKGISQLKMHDVKGAHKTQKNLVKLFPQFKEAHYLGGLVSFTEQDYAGSVEEFNRVLLYNPKHLKALYNRSIAFGISEDYLYAIEDLSLCISLQPDNPLHYYSRAYWYEYTGNYIEAEKDYAQSIVLDPKHYDAYFGLAFIYQNQKESDKACSIINKAISSGSQIAEDLKIGFCK